MTTLRTAAWALATRAAPLTAAVLPAGANLLELGDPENLELEVDVLSTDAVKIEPGDKIMLEHWGGDEPLTGAVRLVEPAAFTKISALGVRVIAIEIATEHQTTFVGLRDVEVPCPEGYDCIDQRLDTFRHKGLKHVAFNRHPDASHRRNL